MIDALLKAASAEHPHVRTRPAALEGPAGKILVDRSAAVDLVIVGGRRRTGHLGFRLGWVSPTLLRHAQCPVAVVPERQ
ncbi:universal stress protein [Streptomyces sp. NPDC096198]|uniref:universal stress protein n=1 Tax=Streptomyces sp. NPDC096198 TaxID=3366080 RepID=UPI0037F7546D